MQSAPRCHASPATFWSSCPTRRRASKPQRVGHAASEHDRTPGAAGMDRVTFITSSGMVWLGLAVHFAGGLVSIVAGTIALSVAKGGWLHKRSGLVFTWAMVG